MNMRLLVTVYSPMHADLLVSRLVDEGIDARLENRATLSVMPIWTVALGGLKVVVPEEQYEEARLLLEKLDAGAEALPDDETDKCPKCGNAKSIERRVGFFGWLSAIFFGLFGAPLPATRMQKRCRWCDRKK
jgi:hypothetical protein